MNPDKTTVTFTSPMGKDGYRLYPTVKIDLKYDNEFIKFWKKYANNVDLKYQIESNLIPEIMQNILEVFVKYQPGSLARLTNNTTITIVSKLEKVLTPNFKPSGATGFYEGPAGIYVDQAYIKGTLDHEIGHALDMGKNEFQAHKFRFPLLLPSVQGTSDYGNSDIKNSGIEAFAEAYRLLSSHGINFRFPNTNEENVNKNVLLDYVADKVKNEDPQFKDFRSNIKYNYDKNKSYGKNDLNSARISTLVGGFQSAYDRFQGNKNIYLQKLLSDKQIQKDIAAYISKTELPFSITPATDEEINLALEAFKKSSNSKSDEYDEIKTPSGSLQRKKSEIETYDFIESASFLIPKSFKDLFVKKPELLQGGTLSYQPEKFINELKPSFVNDPLVSASRNEWLQSNGIIQYYKDKKLIGNYDKSVIEDVFRGLIPAIFPNLKMNNAEDYLFYDFHLNKNNSYELDLDSVKTKIVSSVNSSEKLKNISESRKNFIINSLMKSIQSYAQRYIQLLNQYKTGNTGKHIENQVSTFFNMNDKLSLATKAVDKLFFAKIPRRNLLFMRIYNNSGLSEKEKQELLNYYRSKQNQTLKK